MTGIFFNHNEYATVTAPYNNKYGIKIWTKCNEIIKPTNTNKTAVKVAYFFDKAPEAKGRRHFTGCKASFLISIKSFKIYSELETQQNEINDKNPDDVGQDTKNSVPLRKGGKNNIRFLIH